jgi:hypothetical protein
MEQVLDSFRSNGILSNDVDQIWHKAASACLKRLESSNRLIWKTSPHPRPMVAATKLDQLFAEKYPCLKTIPTTSHGQHCQNCHNPLLSVLSVRAGLIIQKSGSGKMWVVSERGQPCAAPPPGPRPIPRPRPRQKHSIPRSAGRPGRALGRITAGGAPGQRWAGRAAGRRLPLDRQTITPPAGASGGCGAVWPVSRQRSSGRFAGFGWPVSHGLPCFLVGRSAENCKANVSPFQCFVSAGAISQTCGFRIIGFDRAQGQFAIGAGNDFNPHTGRESKPLQPMAAQPDFGTEGHARERVASGFNFQCSAHVLRFLRTCHPLARGAVGSVTLANGGHVHGFGQRFFQFGFSFRLFHRAITAARACSLVRALLGPFALPPLRPILARYFLISFFMFSFLPETVRLNFHHIYTQAACV